MEDVVETHPYERQRPVCIYMINTMAAVDLVTQRARASAAMSDEVSFVNTTSDLCSASVTGVLYAMPCCIGLRYNGTWLYILSEKLKKETQQELKRPTPIVSVWTS